MGYNKILASGRGVKKETYPVSIPVRIETVTAATTIDESWNGGILSCATDALVHILSDDCPIGMKLRCINTAGAGAAIFAIKGSATVGIGGTNQVINGTTSQLTAVVGKELRNTKATALQFDEVNLVKISATEWKADTRGIWAKEG